MGGHLARVWGDRRGVEGARVGASREEEGTAKQEHVDAGREPEGREKRKTPLFKGGEVDQKLEYARDGKEVERESRQRGRA